jgi:putative ubiquitin-RnfH superfamily antitoxin RatB of RatAB toxin-antitoxin module
MGDGEPVRVTVLYSPAARRMLEWSVSVAAGGIVLHALRASGLPKDAPELDLGQARVGIWGCRAELQARLRDGDRVEVLRPLQVDPKIARRERFRRQGSRAAGLFLRKRGDDAPDEKIAPA